MKKILLLTVALISGMLLQAQGVYHLWGMTPFGGNEHLGIIFNTDAKGNYFRIKHHFNIANPGSRPLYTQPVEFNGKLYGMTSKGGALDEGIIFEYNQATNEFVKKIDFVFTNGATPKGSLTLVGSKFYGMTYDGGINYGVIFEWDPVTNVFTKKFNFDQSTGSHPTGTLTLSGGKLYGMTSAGGSRGLGVIFEWDPVTNIYNMKFDFGQYTDGFYNGQSPFGNLSLYNGKFYGMTEGNSYEYGNIFEWDPATNIFSRKINFGYSNGRSPDGSLLLRNGKFYGMTRFGGDYDIGVIFEWDPATNIITKKINFDPLNGGVALGNLSVNGNKFYGITAAGGVNGVGVIFEWDPVTNIYKKKVDLDCTNGCQPWGTLTLSGGKFYGMTERGGSNGAGVIFEWNPSSNIFIKKLDLYTDNGRYPHGNLTFFDGKFYGLASYGGASLSPYNSAGDGVIFEWNPMTGVYTKKFDFGGSDGINPNGSLTTFNGKLYGTASGGINNMGVIFEWDPATNTYSKKFDFYEWGGAGPVGNLIEYGGKLYGMTNSGGGPNGSGVIFEWNPNTNKYKKKITLDQLGGHLPGGSFTLRNGKFYATTQYGGAFNEGAIIEWDPATNTYSNRIGLGGLNGSEPRGNLALKDDKFYGIATFGGVYNQGVIFEWDPETNEYIKKIDFNDYNRAQPLNSLTLSEGKFFGMSGSGGNNNTGILFEWDPETNIYTKKLDFNDTNGASPYFNDLVAVAAPVSSGVPGSCTTFPSVTIDNSNNNKWVSITDNEGNAVAEIKANGNNLGIVTVAVFINNGAVRQDQSKKLYLDRNISITPQVQPSSPVDIRLYIKGSEYLALKNAVNSNGQSAGIDGIYNLSVYKIAGGCLPAVSSLPNANIIGSTAHAWETDYVFAASTSSLSTFYFANKMVCTAPVISEVRISEDTLWPPFHGWRGISIPYKTTGDCKCGTITNWLTVKSNELESGLGNRDLSPDWIILDKFHVRLRAERDDFGTGRIYTITINSKNTAGYISTYDLKVIVPLQMLSTFARGLNGNDEIYLDASGNYPGHDFDCTVTPNPSSQNFNLQVQTASIEKIEAVVFDISGRLIKKLNAVKNQSTNFGNDLKPGMYMIKVTQGNQQKIIQIIKE